MTDVQLADPADASRFEHGAVYEFMMLEPWYVRAWRWLTRYRPPRTSLTIVAVDRDAGIVTYEVTPRS